MLLDMINKQRTSVNVCSYTQWMTGCNWLQPVWCNKAHYYANPVSPSDSDVVYWERQRKREKEERQSKECETESKTEQMNGLCVGVITVCVHARLSVPLRSLLHKSSRSLLSSALTTLLVIRMTFENILTEDKRLNREWVDLSMAKLQLEGWGSTLETMQIETLRICNLSISRHPVLALAFQGESWNNQGALIYVGEWVQMWQGSH